MFIGAQFVRAKYGISLGAHQLKMDKENVVYLHSGVLFSLTKNEIMSVTEK
jgi:hypothetical protein